jgi:hypothetical protein
MTSGLETENTAVGIRCADHATPLYAQNLALTSPTNGDRLVGIVRSLTEATEFRLFMLLVYFRIERTSSYVHLQRN